VKFLGLVSLETKRQAKARQPWVIQTHLSLHVEKTLVHIHPLHPSTHPPTHPSKDVMTTLVNNTKTYATVAAMKSAPHIKDQKATGRPKGVTATGRSTTGVRAIKPTTDRSYQGTTGSSMGETKAQKTQPQDEAKAKLRKALYEIFNVKEPTIIEQKDPIEVKAICYSGRRYSASLVTRPIKMSYTKHGGHKRVPLPDKLMRSKECFHCHKKGHYAHNC